MQIVNTIVESDIFQVLLKLLLSSFLAGLIGIERSSMNKPAGFGTHAIIGLSSALVVMASEYMALNYEIDASRIPSQIIAGIGFIGAGTILRNGFNVRGVTTAAGILSVTCIGIAVGMGYYSAAVLATLIVYFVLSVNHEVSGRFERFEILDVSIVISGNSEKTIDDIQDYFKKESISIQSIKKEDVNESNKTESFRIKATFDSKHKTRNDIISKLITKKNVVEVIDENNVIQ
ncbi:MAG: MgtC/SapB family protein [Bacilli bacterium]|nr:MgtC/SapB family protein [Bacilli bacterium]